MLFDPAVNIVFHRMQTELKDSKEKLDQAQNDLSAWKFTPDRFGFSCCNLSVLWCCFFHVCLPVFLSFLLLCVPSSILLSSPFLTSHFFPFVHLISVYVCSLFSFFLALFHVVLLERSWWPSVDHCYKKTRILVSKYLMDEWHSLRQKYLCSRNIVKN